MRLLLIATIALAASAAQAQERAQFVFAGVGQGEPMQAAYVDVESISHSVSGTAYWVAWVLPAAEKSGVGWTLRHYVADCGARTTKEDYTVVYRADGVQLVAEARYGPPSPVVPGSTGEDIAPLVCTNRGALAGKITFTEARADAQTKIAALGPSAPRQ